ncbi:MAG: alpha/beta hydrolase [Gammaproteobacteria bacterium]|nr:alpha/beta hydrolase [Gammaproteobacteria bacterium]MBU2058642.1 alpha/beta hydrolase [Gammaproteobacteria bacterium]MBU2173594.1 alpha/beta hydrolase [Gammaproteobacteria bacterium]MBU2246548.1 alpha/beta hydrolase [Gammaproteobacteria bacterium]MBU2343221.1 alpha/beta hydrolase [Gammaproteobacteria bacterium]
MIIKSQMTIVVLPGLDGTGTLYQQLAQQLAPDYELQVIAYPLDQLWGYTELLDYIRPQLPQSPYLLLAESFSGPLGIMLSAEKPHHLKALVLCCTFGRNPLPAIKGLASAVDKLPWNELVHHWTALWLQGRYASPQLSALMGNALMMVPEQVIKHRAKQTLQVDVLAEFAALTLPLMYLQARQDRLIWAFNAKTLKQLQPDMQLVRLDAPHFLLQAIPDQAAWQLQLFIEEHLVSAQQQSMQLA